MTGSVGLEAVRTIIRKMDEIREGKKKEGVNGSGVCVWGVQVGLPPKNKEKLSSN